MTTAGASRPRRCFESVVNQRFHFADGVNEAGAAKGKTDQYLELKVPRVYHHNQDRYFRVVRLLPIIDSPALRAERQAAWGQELLDPKTAGVAALKLEGLGVTAVETLKRGWTAPTPRSASSRPRPWPTSTTPRASMCWPTPRPNQREFRAYALAALAAHRPGRRRT